MAGSLLTARRSYVDVGSGQVHVRSLGDGRPLLLVHQNAYSSEMWVGLMPELAACGHRAIAIDLPGYGLSDPWPVRPSLHGYARLAVDVLDALGVGGFDVLGQHLGASVALRLAVDVPQRVGAGIGFGVFLPGGRYESAVTAASPPVYDLEGEEVMRQWRIRWQLGADRFTAEMAVRSLAANLQAGQRRHLGLLAMNDEDHEVLLRALTRPYLAISSERDSFYAESQRAATISPHVRFIDAGDEGLFWPDEDPSGYARVIAGFLREHAATEG
jgi:pimeloyl-ACP methyl ester carboxylesterase